MSSPSYLNLSGDLLDLPPRALHLRDGAVCHEDLSLSFTEANLKAAFDHAQKLIQAKDPQEILAHQSEYVKKQLAAMEEHAKELGTAVLKAVTPDK